MTGGSYDTTAIHRRDQTLSVTERIALIEAITRSLREDLAARQRLFPPCKRSLDKPKFKRRDKTSSRSRNDCGACSRFDGEPPTDEELKEMYTDYLAEKYS
jgi:hypothetical protein